MDSQPVVNCLVNCESNVLKVPLNLTKSGITLYADPECNTGSELANKIPFYLYPFT